MKNLFLLKESLGSFVSLFFPHCCVVCGSLLAKGEQCICTACNIRLPRTDYHLEKENPVEQMFWGKMEVERGTSFFFYKKGSDFRKILHLLKYGGRKDIGEAMGRYVACELSLSDFFQGIDVIVPVPLHEKKQRMRGYNQSECIAHGISLVTHIPMDAHSVSRTQNTATQTQKSTFDRWENVDSVFVLRDPDAFVGKHVLIVDDVLTTGATIASCASAFNGVDGVRVSVLTLAKAE